MNKIKMDSQRELKLKLCSIISTSILTYIYFAWNPLNFENAEVFNQTGQLLLLLLATAELLIYLIQKTKKKLNRQLKI